MPAVKASEAPGVEQDAAVAGAVGVVQVPGEQVVYSLWTTLVSGWVYFYFPSLPFYFSKRPRGIRLESIWNPVPFPSLFRPRSVPVPSGIRVDSVWNPRGHAALFRALSRSRCSSTCRADRFRSNHPTIP